MALDTPHCEFGWKAQPFSLRDPEGKEWTLEMVMGERGLLVAFICNHCPYVKAIAKRLADDARALQAEGIGVVAIMSNDYEAYPADAPTEMTKFAQQYGFPFPYVVDEDQSIGKAYDAVCTPDFFGFNAARELQYRGRLDDARLGDPEHRTPELLNAMRLIAETGAGPREQHHSIGCSIKWR